MRLPRETWMLGFLSWGWLIGAVAVWSVTISKAGSSSCQSGILLYELAGSSTNAKESAVVHTRDGHELRVATPPVFAIQRQHVEQVLITHHELKPDRDRTPGGTVEAVATTVTLSTAAAKDLSEALASRSNTLFLAVCDNEAVSFAAVEKPFLGFVHFDVASLGEARRIAAALADRVVEEPKHRVVETPAPRFEKRDAEP